MYFLPVGLESTMVVQVIHFEVVDGPYQLSSLTLQA